MPAIVCTETGEEVEVRIKFKVENNEPIDNFTYEKFAQKLRANTSTLMKRPDVKDVQFSVYLKDGKVARITGGDFPAGGSLTRTNGIATRVPTMLTAPIASG